MPDSPIDDLRNLIQSRKAVVIVGSGVSIATTPNAPAASWKGLLHLGINHLETWQAAILPDGFCDRQRGLVDKGDLDEMIGAAELISGKLGAPAGGEFKKWLRETVGGLTPKQSEVIQAIQKWNIPLATTNYDSLLTEVTGLSPVTWRQASEVERIIRGDASGILHLHGHWKDSDSVILGVRSYDRVKSDSHAQAVLHALGLVCSLIFVGCGDGLNDPNFQPFLTWLGEAKASSEYRHYRLALNGDVSAARTQHPPEQRVHVLGYGHSHSDLAGFLQRLAPAPLSVNLSSTQPSTASAGSITALTEGTPVVDRITPRGLRSFEAEDHLWYLRLVPGPRDNRGFPTAIRFWQTRLEQRDSDHAFKVGLLFGPSGCGKSSLVKAGIIPALRDDIISVYIEATADGTEKMLLGQLRKKVPALSSDGNLEDSLKNLTTHPQLTQGRKVVVWIDQFEQWLQAHLGQMEGELSQALRLCDGTQFQAVLMIRADFFDPLNRFFGILRILLAEELNFKRAGLPDRTRAREILKEYAWADGRIELKLVPLASESQELKEFLDVVLDSLADPAGNFICAHLALFAEMLKQRDWTPKTWKDMGGVQGVGVSFFRATFEKEHGGRPDAVALQRQALLVFERLLPQEDQDLRAGSCWEADLAQAAGLLVADKKWEDLKHLLDSELKLITPVESDDPASSAARYQLTHDILVPSLRAWMEERLGASRRGRIRRYLKQSSAQWSRTATARRWLDIRDVRHLPGPWDFALILWFTWQEDLPPDQRDFKRTAGIWWSMAGTFLALLLLGGAYVQWEFEKATVDSMVKTLEVLPGKFFAESFKPLQSHPRTAQTLMSQQWTTAQLTPLARSHLALGLALLGDGRFLTDVAARSTNPAARSEFIVAASTVISDPWFLTTVGPLTDKLSPKSNQHTDICSALCSAAALADTNALSSDQREVLLKTLNKIYRTESSAVGTADAGVHSSAYAGLIRWGAPPPPPQPTGVVTNRDWFVNDLGMTFIRLPSGEFQMGGKESDETPHPASIKRPFYLCDREVTVAWFHQFQEHYQACTNFGLAQLVSSQWKGTNSWEGEYKNRSPEPDCPVQQVSWVDAVLFCNWLNYRENRKPLYTPDAKGGWILDQTGTGYRLPTEAEWEYACRAGTTTEYSWGDDSGFGKDYAWSAENSQFRTWPAGVKLPSAWGLFDMHGNVFDWCHDCYDTYPSDAVDYFGPKDGAQRVLRGGSWDSDPFYLRSAYRLYISPDGRSSSLGFRCVWRFSP